jgi:ABC-type polysaccharide/polyol phosphate transport system ATPase subunit
MIRVQNLGKRYRIYDGSRSRLVEWLTLGRIKGHTDFWALKDINLEVGQGECVGIIGPNGAGKSTLLKILSGTATPTVGSYRIDGRVLSLLELGTGFAAELTGRQNVVETSSLLGFPPGYVQKRMSDIEQFAALGDFFDRPIKIYSSGMVVRLAFSMFAFLQPDIFIVDEALAVGDAGFQRKCYRRLEEMLKQGVTCLFVTHDLPAVVKFCHRAMVLNNGEKVYEGEPRRACNLLSKIYFNEAEITDAMDYGDGSAEIERIWFEDLQGHEITSAASKRPLTYCYSVLFKQDADEPVCGFHCKTMHGVEVTLASTDYLGYRLGSFKAGDRAVLRWVLDLNLTPATYFFGCGCKHHDREQFMCRRVDAVRFPITDVGTVGGVCDPIRELRLDTIPAGAGEPIRRALPRMATSPDSPFDKLPEAVVAAAE